MTSELICEVLGQLAGVIAVVFGFISFQLKSRKHILYAQMTACSLFCLHFALIGAVSGAVMNGIGVFRIWVYSNNDKKIFSWKYWPALFVVVLLSIGILTWQAWYSFFSVAGMVLTTIFLAFKNPQSIRRSILITSPLALVYNVIVFSLGGIVYEVVSIISAVIGLFRFSQKKAK